MPEYAAITAIRESAQRLDYWLAREQFEAELAALEALAAAAENVLRGGDLDEISLTISRARLDLALARVRDGTA